LGRKIGVESKGKIIWRKATILDVQKQVPLYKIMMRVLVERMMKKKVGLKREEVQATARSKKAKTSLQ
jgi:hypothetical protein